MKTENILLIGGLAAAAYFLFSNSQAQAQTLPGGDSGGGTTGGTPFVINLAAPTIPSGSSGTFSLLGAPTASTDTTAKKSASISGGSMAPVNTLGYGYNATLDYTKTGSVNLSSLYGVAPLGTGYGAQPTAAQAAAQASSPVFKKAPAPNSPAPSAALKSSPIYIGGK